MSNITLFHNVFRVIIYQRNSNILFIRSLYKHFTASSVLIMSLIFRKFSGFMSDIIDVSSSAWSSIELNIRIFLQIQINFFDTYYLWMFVRTILCGRWIRKSVRVRWSGCFCETVSLRNIRETIPWCLINMSSWAWSEHNGTNWYRISDGRNFMRPQY